MPSEMQLLQLEKLANGIAVGAFTILNTAAIQSQQMLEKNSSVSEPSESNNSGPTPAQLTALAFWITVMVRILFFYIAATRLRQRQEEVQSGQSTTSLIPNYNITFGNLVVLLGFIIEAVGAQQRADEAAPITIV